MYSLYIFLPLLISCITFFLGRFLGKYLIFQIHLISLFVSFCVVGFAFYEVVLNGLSCEIIFFKWFSILSYNINIGFLFDSLSVTVSFVVIFISLLVHSFAIDYMWDDPYFIKFFSFLTLFTSLMLVMVVSSNFIQFFLGWEGVGICSYLLINFWSTRPEANRSALKALILNRFGDVSLYLAFILLFLIFKTFDFYSLNFLVNNSINFDSFILSNEIGNIFSIDIVCFLLLVASVGKSAQIGLHIWLPDAMEGPTPVSALLHAATMVTAGIYLILRCSYIFQFSEFTLSTMSWIGLLTMLIASIIAVGQNDLKKIIAYSTCSHLGYMVIACGSSFYNLALFHLFNHAFFKALLFIAAGSLIHIIGFQDLRKYRNLRLLFPVIYVIFIVGSLSSISFIGSSGYYSKDLIIEHLSLLNASNDIFYGLFEFVVLISTILSTIYSIKLIFLSFNLFQEERNYVYETVQLTSKEWLKIFVLDSKKNHEPTVFTMVPLLILMFFSLFGGFIFFSLFTTSKFFHNEIYIDEKFYVYNLEILFNNTYIELPVLFSFIAILLVISFYYLFKYFSIKSLYCINFIKKLQNNKFYFNLIIIYFFVKVFMILSFNIFFKFLDRGVLDLISPLGIVRKLNYFSNSLNFLQNGSLQYYIFSLIFFFLTSIVFITAIILNLLQILVLNIIILFFFIIILKNDEIR